MSLEQYTGTLQYLGVGLMASGLLTIITGDNILGGFSLIFYGLGGMAVEQITGKSLSEVKA